MKQMRLEPVILRGIHCSAERKMEYGTASLKDYKGRGAKAGCISNLFLKNYSIHKINWQDEFKEKSYAGFSLGGLSAIDTVWHNPDEFSKTGVFSALYGGG